MYVYVYVRAYQQINFRICCLVNWVYLCIVYYEFHFKHIISVVVLSLSFCVALNEFAKNVNRTLLFFCVLFSFHYTLCCSSAKYCAL